MNDDHYQLLIRRGNQKDLRIDLFPAGGSLGEALRLLGDVVDETMGAGAQVIDGWGIGFQFQHGGSIFDLRLVSGIAQLRCLHSPFASGSAADERETQEVPAVNVSKARARRTPKTKIGSALKQESAARMVAKGTP